MTYDEGALRVGVSADARINDRFVMYDEQAEQEFFSLAYRVYGEIYRIRAPNEGAA